MGVPGCICIEDEIANSHLQKAYVLVMVTVHLMVGVMSQVELALVMKDFMETSVKVISSYREGS